MHLAQLGDVGMSRYSMLNTVDRVDSRNRSCRTVYSQVDSHNGVAIAVDRCELIEARSVQDGFGVIGRNCRHHIIRPYWTPATTVTLVVSEAANVVKTAAHAMAMTPRMRKTRKVLFSSGAGVVVSTFEDCVGCRCGRAFSRASRPGNCLAGPPRGWPCGYGRRPVRA